MSGAGGSRILRNVVVAVVVAGAVIGVKFYNKSSASGEVKQEAIQMLVEAGVGTEAEITPLVVKHHDTAFEAAYTMGGRRRSSKFNSEVYLQVLSSKIGEDLKASRGGAELPQPNAPEPEAPEPATAGSE